MATEPNRVALPELLSRLLTEGTALARAEVALAIAKVTTKVDAAKWGAVLIVASAIAALLGAIGLVVGCVMALATIIGPGFAGLVVCGVLLVAAAILYKVGSSRLSAEAVPSGGRP